MAAGNVVGKVIVLQGQAFARGKDGSQRVLKIGDPVHEGEALVTSAGGHVELAFGDGRTYLLREKETLTLDASVFGADAGDPKAAALLSRVTELTDVARAIAAGNSLDELLEETAAGLTGSGGDNGHSFVQLLRIAEALPASPYDFGFGDSYVVPELVEEGRSAGQPGSGASESPAGGPVVTLSASAASVSEGGSIVYTASVNNPVTGSDLVITLSNGQSITIPVGQSSADGAAFAVRGDDAYVQGTQTLAVGISSTSGGNYEGLTTSSTVSTDVVDDLDSTTVHLAATPSVAEGATITYTATLDRPSTLGAVTVTLSNGETISIAQGALSGTVSVAAGDDYYLGGGSASVTITGATGGNFESLAIDGTAAVTTITDEGIGNYGPEDTIYAIIEGSGSVTEGGSATYTIRLVDSNGAPVTVNADTAVTVRFSNGTAEDGDYQYVDGATATFTVPNGSSSVSFPVSTVNDVLVEANETFSVAIVSVADTGQFENIDSSSSVTTAITNNDAFTVSAAAGDDDDVNENRDADAGNDIVHAGTIGNVAPDVVLAIDDSVVAGLTSNGKSITYAWDAGTRTLTASTTDGTVFTVALNATNDGYAFKQFRGIDHAVLAGEAHSLDIPLTVVAKDAAGNEITTAGFAITVSDDAPTVSGDRIIVSQNDGNYTESGYLTEATLSNDITSVRWNVTGLPSLVFEGKPVLYVDHLDGTLTGELADGTLVFRARIDPNVVDASNSPQYSFELLNTLGRLGLEGSANSYTVISGGNIDTLDLGFGGFLIDSMSAQDGGGAISTVNSNANWIGIGGNWFDPDEKLFMSFTDPSGNAGQVRGMNLVVEGQGGAPYTLTWTVTAAVDFSGSTVTYSGTVSGAGNADVPFDIPLSGGALYFTSLEISDTAGQFRIAFSGVTANNYFADIPLDLNYTLTDADGDTAGGAIDVTLISPLPALPDSYDVTEGSTYGAVASVVGNDGTASLTVTAVASSASGTNQAAVDGTATFATALGGSVVMQADGTFTYTAPVGNHAGGAVTDYIYYRASNGSSSTPWTRVDFRLADTAPVPLNDTDTVGFGGSTGGNVVTGAATTSGAADVLGADAPTTVTNVAFNGTPVSSSYSNGIWTIETANGILTINQSGQYVYDSKLLSVAVEGNSQSAWNAAVDGYYGYGSGDSPFVGGNAANGLDPADLNPAHSGQVNFSSSSGLGVGGSLVNSSEHIAFWLKDNAASVSLKLNDFGNNDYVDWYAFNASRQLVGSGTKRGNDSDIVVATPNISPAESVRYVVLKPQTGGDGDMQVYSLSYGTDPATVTPDVFTYTLSDADGSAASATLTLDHSTTVVASPDSGQVFEAGLADGTQPGVLATTVTGNILDNDSGISATTAFTQFNGTDVTGQSTYTTTTALGTLNVWLQADATHRKGDYQYTLNDNSAGGDSVAETFNYTISTNGTAVASTLTVNVADDAPIGYDVSHTLQAASGTPTYNLVLVVDRSGSMAMDANGNWSDDAGFDASTVRMNIAKDALAQLIDRFDQLGNVNIQVVDFASGANESGWFVDDTHGAVNYIDGLQAGGGTQYSTALNAVMTGFTPPAADRTLFYFITDGQPNAGYEATLVQSNWETFVAGQGSGANAAISFGIGIGSASLAAVNPVAYPNTDADSNGQEDYAIKVADPTDLADTLLATVSGGVVVGNVSVLSGGGSSGFLMGADGGELLSVTVDGVTYTHVSGGPDSITVSTIKGGELTINFVTGEYGYQLALNATTQGRQEVFQVTAIDNDGDSKTINMVINLDYVANLDANRDIILTNVATGTPIDIPSSALMHNDSSSGGGAVTSVQNPVSGTVSGTGPVQFTSNGIPAATITITNEAPYDNQDAYGGYNDQPQSDVYENAVDLTDRSKFGTVVPGGESLSIDQAGATRVFRGQIENSGGGTRDTDYFKLKLYAGERVFVDIDNQATSMAAQMEYQDGSGTWQTVAISEVSFNPNGWFVAPQDGEFYLRLRTDSSTTDTNYELLLTLDQANAALAPSGQFDYTVTENSVQSSATAVVYNVSGTTINGGDDGEILIGGATDDTLKGVGGHDVLLGNAGNDQLYGGEGFDRLEGGAGNDVLDGGAGNDTLIGGAGNDSLTGGLGADVFRWDLADQGTAGSPALDTITDFDSTASSDKLDLRDLLAGEVASGAGANLEDYLHFEYGGGNTTVHISSTGGFSGGYAPGQEDQTIVLQNVDLVGGFSTDQQVIQDLLNKGKLITD